MPWLGLVGLVIGFIELGGATRCPTADEVAARLRDLVPDAAAATAPRERVTLAEQGGALELALHDGSGRTIGRRRLEAAPCADLAQAAAVVIAAWDTDLRAGQAPTLVLPRPPPPPRLALDVAGGFVASFAGAAFAPGGELALTLGPRRGRLAGRILATGTATRDLDVGQAAPAHVSFTRASLALGPVVRFRPGRFVIDLGGHASAALVYLAGVGFADSASAWDADVGLGGGVRAALRLGRVAPYLGARVEGWLRPLSARVTGPTGGTVALPRFEVLLGAGLAVGRY